MVRLALRLDPNMPSGKPPTLATFADSVSTPNLVLIDQTWYGGRPM